MKLSSRPLLLLLSSTAPTVVLGLQTIYTGHRTSGNTNKCGTYYTFFSDSDPCTSGVSFGNYACFQTPRGLCAGNPYTLLGHEGISFVGCGSADSTGHFPTGVLDAPNADEMNPDLTCGSDGADGPLGEGGDLSAVKIECPAGALPGTYYPFTVYVNGYCH